MNGKIKKRISGHWINFNYKILETSMDSFTTSTATLLTKGNNATVKVYGAYPEFPDIPSETDPIYPYEYGINGFGHIEIPITSGGTTTTFSLASVTSTRVIKKKVFDYTDTFTKGGSGASAYFVMNLGDSMDGQDCVCSHFVNTPITGSTTDVGVYITSNSKNVRFRTSDIENQSADDFNGWVLGQYNNGTPLTIWYVLDENYQYTGMVEEPLRKIGIYADSVANLSVPTLDGSNFIYSETTNMETLDPITMYPSQFDVTYKGWHPKQVKISANNSWS